MERLSWESAVLGWEDQALALFARRAHRYLGRGFVLLSPDDVQPVYVTWMVGAPQPLIEAVYAYNPEREALVVVDEDDESDTVTVSCVRIEIRH